MKNGAEDSGKAPQQSTKKPPASTTKQQKPPQQKTAAELEEYLRTREVLRSKVDGNGVDSVKTSIVVDGFQYTRQWMNYRAVGKVPPPKDGQKVGGGDEKQQSIFAAKKKKSGELKTESSAALAEAGATSTSGLETREATKTVAPNTTSGNGPIDYTAIFFLSHYHSDHYIGLHQNWRYGTMYCTPSTARLAVSELGLDASRVRPLDLNTSYIFNMKTGEVSNIDVESGATVTMHNGGATSGGGDSTTTLTNNTSAIDGGSQDGASPNPVKPRGLRSDGSSRGRNGAHKANRKPEFFSQLLSEHEFEVILIDANHCPGATMIIFRSNRDGLQLHTGDCRYNGTAEYWAKQHADYADHYLPARFRRFVGDDPILRSISTRGGLDVLFMDNTFCDPAYNFKPQAYAFRAAVQHVHNAMLQAVKKRFSSEASFEAVVLPGGVGVDTELVESPQQQEQGEEEDNNGSVVIRLAVMVGTYTIGKERVALALRELLQMDSFTTLGGDRPPILVSPTKRKLLEHMGFDTSGREFLDGNVLLSAGQTIVDIEGCAKPPPAVLMELQRLGKYTVDVQFRVSLYLVPLSVLSYPYLANAMGYSVGKKKKEEATAGGEGVQAAVPQAEASAAPLDASLALQQESSVGSVPQLVKEASLKDVAASLAAASAASNLGNGIDNNNGSATAADGATTAPHVGLLELWDGFTIKIDDFDAIVGFEPTGWVSLRSQSRTVKKVGPRIAVHSIEYSEHSAYGELLAFVKLLKPLKVVPTVSLKTFTKHEHAFVENCPRLLSKHSNVQPLSKFKHLFTKKKPGEDAFSHHRRAASKDGAAVNVVSVGTATTKPKQSNPFASGGSSGSGGVVPRQRARAENPQTVHSGSTDGEKDYVEISQTQPTPPPQPDLSSTTSKQPTNTTLFKRNDPTMPSVKNEPATKEAKKQLPPSTILVSAAVEEEECVEVLGYTPAVVTVLTSDDDEDVVVVL